MIFWKDKVQDLINGINLPQINKNIFFETSPIDFNKKNWGIYTEKQIKTNKLSEIENTQIFNKLHSKNVTIFNNLGNDCILVCPPKDGKNYSHINNFYKNANAKLIKLFWKKVGKTLIKLSKNNNNIYWVSTHGTAVPWLHLRICKSPKYYQTKSLIKPLNKTIFTVQVAGKKNNSKTKTRKSPTESATLFTLGTIMKGNDGNMWIITETKTNIKRWKKI